MLGEAMEDQPAGLRFAAIESEGEFVKIVVKMLMLDAALVSANQPSLEQRSDEVDARHYFVRRVGAAAEDRDLMLVTGRRRSSISPGRAITVGVSLGGVAGQLPANAIKAKNFDHHWSRPFGQIV